ncbi:MAG TPA: spermidine/putrescine ABC transporter substrate-binding protein, partial [Demequina sp.]|nr:spermidine/putrescine ABC transporter substrate-binding protein [Demequina sp.]
ARLCRQCFGSPVIAAAGLSEDVPHAVQHALAMRMKIVVDASVDEYTETHLPLLAHELRLDEARRARRVYRPAEGLDPEHRGLDLDPPPASGAPYLFTFGELAGLPASDEAVSDGDDSSEVEPEPPPPLSAEEKAAVLREVAVADAYAAEAGRRVCAELARHRVRLRAAVAEFVEPQVRALLADLESTLDSPLWPRGS